MNIIWDQKKNDWLVLNRNISFQIIANKILEKDYLDIIENSIRKD